MAFILIILPLPSFTTTTLFLHKDEVKKLFTKSTAKFKLSNNSNKSNNNSIEESETLQSKKSKLCFTYMLIHVIHLASYHLIVHNC